MTEAHLKVLHIEDDDALSQLTASYLESNGVDVVRAPTGAEGLARAFSVPPDVILLDVGLPGLNGVEVCRSLRERLDTPIVMVTGHDSEAERILGLEAGADDYLAKPFSLGELLARIRAQARRACGTLSAAAQTLAVGALRLYPRALFATLEGRALKLTSYEFALLKALAERAGSVLGREALMELIRGAPDEAFDRSIDAHISRLRRKLGDDPRDPKLLKTVRGFGYLLACPQAPPG